MNVEGYANLVKIQHTSDSTFVALPFAHAADAPPVERDDPLDRRARSTGATASRSTPTSQPVGPLSLPTPTPMS